MRSCSLPEPMSASAWLRLDAAASTSAPASSADESRRKTLAASERRASLESG